MTLETAGQTTRWRLLCKTKGTLRRAAKVAQALYDAAPDDDVGLRAAAVAQAIAELLNPANATRCETDQKTKALPTWDRT